MMIDFEGFKKELVKFAGEFKQQNPEAYRWFYNAWTHVTRNPSFQTLCSLNLPVPAAQGPDRHVDFNAIIRHFDEIIKKFPPHTDSKDRLRLKYNGSYQTFTTDHMESFMQLYGHDLNTLDLHIAIAYVAYWKSFQPNDDGETDEKRFIQTCLREVLNKLKNMAQRPVLMAQRKRWIGIGVGVFGLILLAIARYSDQSSFVTKPLVHTNTTLTAMPNSSQSSSQWWENPTVYVDQEFLSLIRPDGSNNTSREMGIEEKNLKDFQTRVADAVNAGNFSIFEDPLLKDNQPGASAILNQVLNKDDLTQLFVNHVQTNGSIDMEKLQILEPIWQGRLESTIKEKLCYEILEKAVLDTIKRQMVENYNTSGDFPIDPTLMRFILLLSDGIDRKNVSDISFTFTGNSGGQFGALDTTKTNTTLISSTISQSFTDEETEALFSLYMHERLEIGVVDWKWLVAQFLKEDSYKPPSRYWTILVNMFVDQKTIHEWNNVRIPHFTQSRLHNRNHVKDYQTQIFRLSTISQMQERGHISSSWGLVGLVEWESRALIAQNT